jgi:hypothetical protein
VPFCQKCGRPGDTAYCSACGAKLQQSTPEPAQEIGAAAKAPPKSAAANLGQVVSNPLVDWGWGQWLWFFTLFLVPMIVWHDAWLWSILSAYVIVNGFFISRRSDARKQSKDSASKQFVQTSEPTSTPPTEPTPKDRPVSGGCETCGRTSGKLLRIDGHLVHDDDACRSQMQV